MNLLEILALVQNLATRWRHLSLDPLLLDHTDELSYLISLNQLLFNHIVHAGSSKHFVFVYLCVCVFLI